MDKIIDFIRSLNSKQYSYSCHHFDVKRVYQPIVVAKLGLV